MMYFVQVLRVVEALPLTADDLHTTTSAQGCFADTLRGLFIHSNMDSSPEVLPLSVLHRLATCIHHRMLLQCS